MSTPTLRLAILTISDGVQRGHRQDGSGAAIAAWGEAQGYTLVGRLVVGDETDRISAALLQLSDETGADLLITTGGTGLTARDVTPEATRAVLDRQAPGIAEAIRQAGAPVTPFAWLSRGLAGTRGKTLIVNLPGSEGGVRDGLAVLGRLAGHAVQLLRGNDTATHEPPHA